MANNPVGRILSDSALGLARLSMRVSGLRAIDFEGIKECEREFDKIRSKLENVQLFLINADESVLTLIRTDYRVLAEAIQEYTDSIAKSLDEKKWLYRKWERLQIVLSFFGVVRTLLSFFGITLYPKLLPLPRDSKF